MLGPPSSARDAAALIAVAIVIIGPGCGGSGSGQPSDTALRSSNGNTSASSSGGRVIDLNTQAGVVRLAGEDEADLVTGSHSLAFGDFDNDGRSDLLVGAPQADGPENQRTDGGEAYVIFGPLAAERTLGAGKADVTIFGAQPGDSAGFSVLSADLNGDGVKDILVGAPGVTAGFDPRSDQGRIYVFWGGPGLRERRTIDLASDAYDFTVTGAEGFSRLGHSMAAGDVNGDGVTDLVAGAPFAGRQPGSPPGSERTAVGEVYIIFGGKDLKGEKNIAGLEQDVLISGAEAFGQFGASTAVSDLNGDGKADIVTAAYRGSAGDRPSGGTAYVFYGRSDFNKRLAVADGDQDVTILGPAAGAAFGFPITGGDFNGDGKGDVAVGAQLESGPTGGQSQGALRAFYGKDLPAEIDLSKTAADVTVTGRMAGEIFPSSLASADLNDDGADELVIGSQLAGAGQASAAGAVWVLEGRALPSRLHLAVEPAWLSVPGAAAGDGLGGAVAAGKLSDGQSAIAALAAAAVSDGKRAGIVYALPVQP